MSELLPGRLAALFTTGDEPQFYRARCGACHTDSQTVFETDPFPARRALNDEGWTIHSHFGWICPACRSFIYSIPPK